MKTLAPLFALILFAAPLAADDAAKAATAKLLESLTEVKDSALGKEELRFSMLGVDTGKFAIEVTRAEHEGKSCYAVTVTGVLNLGELKRDYKTTAKVAPNLALISEESIQSDDGVLAESMTWAMQDGVYKVHVIKKDAVREADRDQKFDLKPEPGLMAGVADMLLPRVLPAQAGKYVFREWDHDSNKVYDMAVEVSTPAEGECRVVQKSTEADKDEEGTVTARPKVTTTLLKAGKFSRVELSNFMVVSNDALPKRTPISAEAMGKLEKEQYAPALMFMASLERNEEKMSKAVSLDRFAENALDKSEEGKAMTKEQRDQAMPFVKANVLEGLIGKEKKQSATQKKGNAGAVKLLLNEENFVVSKGEGSQMKVALGEDAQKLFGKLEFIVEKNKENQWQIVWITSTPREEVIEEETPDEAEKG